jgi:hypothetical protein
VRRRGRRVLQRSLVRRVTCVARAWLVARRARILLCSVDTSHLLSCSRCDILTLCVSRRQELSPAATHAITNARNSSNFEGASCPFTVLIPTISPASHRPLTTESLSIVRSAYDINAHLRCLTVHRDCKGVAVTRRRSDSWLNATQILNRGF